MPWCMSQSLTRGGGENVPGIPGACATSNFTYLARGPWVSNFIHQKTMRCNLSSRPQSQMNSVGEEFTRKLGYIAYILNWSKRWKIKHIVTFPVYWRFVWVTVPIRDNDIVIVTQSYQCSCRKMINGLGVVPIQRCRFPSMIKIRRSHDRCSRKRGSRGIRVLSLWCFILKILTRPAMNIAVNKIDILTS